VWIFCIHDPDKRQKKEKGLGGKNFTIFLGEISQKNAPSKHLTHS